MKGLTMARLIAKMNMDINKNRHLKKAMETFCLDNNIDEDTLDRWQLEKLLEHYKRIRYNYR